MPFSLIGQFLSSDDGYTELENAEDASSLLTIPAQPKDIGPGVILGLQH